MSAGTPHRTRGSVQTRLPWWGLVLPAVAFAVLFALLATPAAPESGTALAATGALSHLVDFVQHSMGA
ncbi:hypothetical protein [Streptomyces sp. NPDC002537]